MHDDSTGKATLALDRRSWSRCDGCEAVAGTPTAVYDDARDALALTLPSDHVYADPPYSGQRKYAGGSGDYLDLIQTSRGRLVLSEGPRAADRLPGWVCDIGSVVARASGGVGADGRRSEVIYVRPQAQRAAEIEEAESA